MRNRADAPSARKLLIVTVLALLTIAASATSAFAQASDNDTNRAKGWAHFNVLEVRRGEADIEFVSTRSFRSCFEHRSDGGTATRECVQNSTATVTISAEREIQIRLSVTPESDERFDWTSLAVLPTAQVLLDDLIAAGGITEALAGKVQHALNTAAEWLQIEGKTGPALSHYDRAIHLILWQIDVINKGKDQGDPEGLAELAQAIQELADLYR